MRTVAHLLALKGHVFVRLGSENLARLFLKNAEAEGFTWVDGAKPTERITVDIIALRSDWTINTVGWAGHMAFRNPGAVIGEPLIRVDYGKYVVGDEKYLIE